MYWASTPSRRHSEHIKNDPKTAVAVAVEFVNGEAVVGVQMEGLSEELQAPLDILPIAKKYARRYKRDEKWVQDISDGKTDHRIYKFKPKAIYLFDEVNFPGGERQPVKFE